MSLFPITSSNPFAYREPLDDAKLDILLQAARRNDAYSVNHGWISQEKADEYRRLRESNREESIRADRGLEAAVRAMYRSDTESEFDDNPLTPPRSPSPNLVTEESLLSEKEWRVDLELMEIRGRHDPRMFGFNDYEKWKQYQIRHRQPQPQSPERKSTVRNLIPGQPLSGQSPLRSPVALESDASGGENIRARITRARALHVTSQFYELAEDGKTPREIRPLSSNRVSHHVLAPNRSSYRIQKRTHRNL